MLRTFNQLRKKEDVETYDVFLVWYQSNTDGRVPVIDGDAPIWIKDNIVDGVLTYNLTELIPIDLYNTGKFGTGRHYSAASSGSEGLYSWTDWTFKLLADEGKKIIVCQVTSGGTGLYDIGVVNWNPYYGDKTDKTYLLRELKERYLSLVKYLNINKIRYSLRGVLFHGGETDYIAGESAYKANLTAVISDIRSWTGLPFLPMFYGTVPSISGQYSAIVRQAHLDIASEINDMYCRDNNDLTLLDLYHFDCKSVQRKGFWAYDMVKRVIYNNN